MENEPGCQVSENTPKKKLLENYSPNKNNSPDKYNDDDEIVNIVDRNDKKLTKKIGLALGKDTSSKAINTEIRNSFSHYLAKLNDNSTLDVGFNEIKNMINQFDTKESLRIYIGQLSILNKNCTHQAKEVQALIIGYIASIYRENLIDPLDKPSSILKTINRMLDILKHFMKV